MVLTPGSSCGSSQPWGVTGSFPIRQPLLWISRYFVISDLGVGPSTSCVLLPVEKQAFGPIDTSPERWAAGDPHKGRIRVLVWSHCPR